MQRDGFDGIGCDVIESAMDVPRGSAPLEDPNSTPPTQAGVWISDESTLICQARR
jgi:hypothetical protein